MTLILICLSLLFADDQVSPAEKAWLDWKKQAYEEALTSPTSFLNAYDYAQAQQGQSLSLVFDEKASKAHWQKQKPKSQALLQAEHTGARIRIQKKGKTLGYLKNKAQQRRQQIPLSFGHIAEVVFGKRNGKMWGYVYDPQQIKKFTGFRFYPFNDKALVTAQFKKQKPHFVSYKTVQGDPTKVLQVGNVSFSFQGQDYYLPAYNWQPEGEKINYIALVFTDNSRGQKTYGGGRELVIDLANGLQDKQKLSIDFNRSMNFYCAHSPFWHCPVGLQKHLNVDLKAGEMLPLKKII